jgi:hypothetical protein
MMIRSAAPFILILPDPVGIKHPISQSVVLALGSVLIGSDVSHAVRS